MTAQRTPAPTGLIAYLPTPVQGDRVDLAAFGRLVERAAAAGVDGLGVLGSTGAAMHLGRDERRDVVRTAVERTDLPVLAGISGLRTSLVRAHADDAQAAGAAAVLLAPVGYVPLVDAEVITLFTDVVAGLDVPLVVYDNPGTTRVDMSHGLLAELAALPGVGGIKTPGPTGGPDDARRRVAELRTFLPDGVTLGFSGDPSGPAGLLAGADTWHSTVGGALPDVVVPLARAAREGDESVHASVENLAPLWDLVRAHAGVRVSATIVELLGLVDAPSLPRASVAEAARARS